MNIAIVGAGNVGAALASAWTKAGHSVALGVRNASDPKAGALASKLHVRVLSVPQAVQSAEVVVLATPWSAARSVIENCGALKGKVLIDCTNPIASDLSGLAIGHTSSGGEQVAAWASGASVFKCFNQTGAENMTGAASFSAKPVMFVAGDDDARKPQVLQLAADAGFEALDAGPLSAARLLEPLAMLWIHLAFRRGLGRDFAFALARRR